jgi:hypothetical protein
MRRMRRERPGLGGGGDAELDAWLSQTWEAAAAAVGRVLDVPTGKEALLASSGLPQEPPAEPRRHTRQAAHPRRRATARPWPRLPVLAGGIAAGAAATAAAVLVLTSGPGIVAAQQGTAGHARTVVTAAWTVHEDSDGTVIITVRQYANPAGLQRTLRADGINAIVRRVPSPTLPGRKPGPTLPMRPVTSCSYATTNNAPPKVQRAVVTVVQQDLPEPRGRVMRIATFIIHPHAMPHGSALFLPYGTLPRATKGSRGPAKPAPVYPHVKPFYPVVLNTDAVPACVPFTK